MPNSPYLHGAQESNAVSLLASRHICACVAAQCTNNQNKLEVQACVRRRGWLVRVSPDVSASQRDAHLLELAISNGHTVLQAHNKQFANTLSRPRH
jgi:hypothetical protein